MHTTSLLNLVLAAVAALPRPATAAAMAIATATTPTDWSFTFYDADGCNANANANLTSNSTAAPPHRVEGSGDVACAAVPDPAPYGSILGAIPPGAACAIHFYTDGACGSRLAFGLTGRTDGRCLSLAGPAAGAAAALRSYEALSCG